MEEEFKIKSVLFRTFCAILIGLVIVILGVLALLVLLIVYLFRKSVINNDDVIYADAESYFDEIQIDKDNNDF